MYPSGGGLKGGQKNVLDLSMSDVVINMGEMGEGGIVPSARTPAGRIASMQILITCRTGHQLRQGLLHSGKTANLNCK